MDTAEDSQKSRVESKSINPITNKPYSAKYNSLWIERRGLAAAAYREVFLSKLRRRQVVIVIGEPGTGKTTQLPQFAVLAGYCSNGRQVVCAQLHDLAVPSICKRVSDEMDVEFGQQVGYSTEEEDRTSQRTMLK